MPPMRKAAAWLLFGLLPLLSLVILLAGTQGSFAMPAENTPAMTRARAPSAASLDPPPLAIAITKTVGTAGPCPATRAITVSTGTPVIYCITMRNTGALAVDTHDLVDSHLGTLLAAVSQTVAPGATLVVTTSVAATTSVTNLAEWTSWIAGGPSTVATDTSTATVTVLTAQPQPSIVLTKTVGLNPHACATTKTLTVVQGTQVIFCYRIRNTGVQPLQHHSLEDAALGPLLDSITRTVPPGATTFVTTAATANLTSTAVATWTAWVTSAPGPSATDTDSATLNVIPRKLAVQLTKTVGKGNACAAATNLTINPGEKVVYCYKVKNTGNVTLNTHKLVDNKVGTLNATGPLLPGETRIFTVSVTVGVTTTNVATWTSWLTTTASPSTLAVAQATVRTPHLPNITFAKTVGTNPHECGTSESATVLAGFEAVYCYRVTNSGNVPVRLHKLEDAQFGMLLSNYSHTLAVGASLAVTTSFTADITRTTVATWTAWETDLNGLKVRKTDTATVKVTPNPARVVLEKTVGVKAGAPCPTTRKIFVPPGTTVYYCYAVQNTGTITLPKHQLYDDDLNLDLIGEVLDGYPLAPGEILTTRDLGFEFSKMITQTTVNFAVWQSYINDVLYAQSDARATVTVLQPEIDASVTVGPELCSDDVAFTGSANDPYSLCARITNTGAMTLTHHRIEITGLGLSTSVQMVLAPGKTITLTRMNAGLGPFPFQAQDVGVHAAQVISTHPGDGAPFTATDASNITLFLAGETRNLYLPVVERD